MPLETKADPLVVAGADLVAVTVLRVVQIRSAAAAEVAIVDVVEAVAQLARVPAEVVPAQPAVLDHLAGRIAGLAVGILRAGLGAIATVVDRLAGGVALAVDPFDADAHLARFALIPLAGRKGLDAVCVGEVAVRLVRAGVVSQVVTGAALRSFGDSAAAEVAWAVGVTSAGGQAAVASIRGVLVAVVTDLITRLTRLQVGPSDAVAASPAAVQAAVESAWLPSSQLSNRPDLR